MILILSIISIVLNSLTSALSYKSTKSIRYYKWKVISEACTYLVILSFPVFIYFITFKSFFLFVIGYFLLRFSIYELIYKWVTYTSRPIDESVFDFLVKILILILFKVVAFVSGALLIYHSMSISFTNI